MPVGLPSLVDTAESDPDLDAVMLFCLIHLLPVATVEAAMLLAGAG
jgi:hypothetical protein